MWAIEEGFNAVGIAPAGVVVGRDRFEEWLAAGHCGGMSFLKRDLQKRFCPQLLLEGAESVICLAVSYAPGHRDAETVGRSSGFVARYARGRDYHRLLKKRCRALMDRLEHEAPGFCGRACVDSAPLAERSLAAAAGMGWIGRNGCLIVPDLGSYIVLAEIVCNLKLARDYPIKSQCGECDACVAACPTGALLGDGTLDAGRCLSYLTIEHRGQVDNEYLSDWGLRVFGCDTCQEICPHNRSAPPGDEQLRVDGRLGDQFRVSLQEASLAELLSWDEGKWDEATTGSATRRAKLDTLLRNAAIASGNSGRADLVGPLRYLARKWPELAEVTDWAIARLSGDGPNGD